MFGCPCSDHNIQFQSSNNVLRRLWRRSNQILQKEPSKNYPLYASKVIDLIKQNRSWVKELVEMRVEVTHFSDLAGLSCFLIKKSEEGAKIATVFYPAMSNGQRVSKYMGVLD